MAGKVQPYYLNPFAYLLRGTNMHWLGFVAFFILIALLVIENGL